MVTHKTYLFVGLFLLPCSTAFCGSPIWHKAKRVLKKEVLLKANAALTMEPLTITAIQSARSAGGLHDFYSEGDYWWPNPNNLDGAYIQKDGLTNPNNFVAHRKAMIRFSQIIGALTSAYLITKDEQYVTHAVRHLKAWFIDTATFMHPSLLYAQAIKGKVTGRGIGIIDMIQMMEVAQSVRVLEHSHVLNNDVLVSIKNWFSTYLQWVTTHPYGIEERDAKNNHATCWVMQVAVFAKLVGNHSLIDTCKQRFASILLPQQLGKNGSFPLELKRTKPYAYSLFNLDAMATICHVLSNSNEVLWNYSSQEGSTIKNAINFLYPFVKNKENWRYPKDVMYWNDWPVAQPFLIFGYNKFKNKKWLTTWKHLDHYPETEEVVRNLPIRHPLIWLLNN